jgi:hypothetical protein
MVKKEISLSLDKNILFKEWERFEQLADDKDELWKIFWAISNDKEEIIKEKICAISYFSEYVMNSLEKPMKEFISEKKLKGNDIETLLSLFFQLIPKSKCETCDGQKFFIDKLDKHYNQKRYSDN